MKGTLFITSSILNYVRNQYTATYHWTWHPKEKLCCLCWQKDIQGSWSCSTLISRTIYRELSTIISNYTSQCLVVLKIRFHCDKCVETSNLLTMLCRLLKEGWIKPNLSFIANWPSEHKDGRLRQKNAGRVVRTPNRRILLYFWSEPC